MSIPSIYQQVEYIQTDGNQYIDTGVIPSDYTDGIHYELDFSAEPAGSNNTDYLFGCLSGEGRSGNFGAHFTQGNIRLIAGSTSSNSTYDWYNIRNRCIVRVFATSENPSSRSLSFERDGTVTTPSPLTSTYESKPMPSESIYLFNCRGISRISCAVTCWGFTMGAADGTPIRNFVPCYRKSDNVAGLYDTVTSVFYENSGTGTFTVGADIDDDTPNTRVEMYTVESSTLQGIADAIRAKTGSSAKIIVANFASEIGSITGGESITYPIADKPQTLAQMACLARAAQMREIQYTPVADIPANGEMAGTTYKGLDYSSVRDTDKFVGFNVSFETFLTAMRNPKSVIYTKTSTQTNASLWYGVNCTTFVSYALGMPYFHTTKTITEAPGVVQIPLEDIGLCDFINVFEGLGGHAILITGITRDKDGNIVTIETSESGGLGDRSGGRVAFSFVDFVAEYIDKGYSVYRYTKLHEAPYIADKYIPLPGEPTETIVHSDLCTDLGDKATIRTDETITLNPLVTDGYTAIKLYKDGVEIGSYAVGDVKLENLETGKYTARLYPEKENASTSFIVADVKANRIGTRYYFSGDGKPMRVIFKQGSCYTIHAVNLTEDDLARGYKDIDYADDLAQFVCVPFQNEYGCNVAQFLYNAKQITDYPYTITAADLAASMMAADGTPVDGDPIRIYTKGLLEIPGDAVVSVSRSSGYRWICYFFDESGTYIGKTEMQTVSASNILDVSISSGTKEGAKYFRIAMATTGADADLTGREAEFAENVVVKFDTVQEKQPYTLTSGDMSVGTVNGDGSVGAGTNRMYTTEPISLSDGTVSIDIAAPYQWLCYYSSQPYFDSSSFLGKTSFGGDSIDDVLTATLSQGTVEGAKYIRISLRDSTNTNADLTGRIDEFMSAITITVTGGGGSSASLISFTIDGTSYQAEEGMTWAEWADSDYNTGGWFVRSLDDGSFVINAIGSYVQNDGVYVLDTDVIIANTAYKTHGGSGA